jgi:septal ring factor EnvC (AmiA/AmiB activator)
MKQRSPTRDVKSQCALRPTNNSPELQQAIREAGEETQDNIQFLKQRIARVSVELEGLDQRKRSNLKKMDLLMDGTAEEIDLFRKEFAKLLGDVEKEKADLELKRISLERELTSLKGTSFSWREVSEQAQRVQEIMLEKDPVALKNAMHILFRSIEIGPEPPLGPGPSVTS